ncbi:type VI secretion system membrane subunit TssM [Pseudomonas sp. MWU13-2100]|uniref:type VI secretion system membrane subunit TssM n=1 Tax=Pseudomonas sp. MWU13-2100 TaxID=2935075 RepID=UPI00200C9EF8|nr:type VI secretion system membrane subunit TssM [Pseudomonas sp. MWU13-2100]
MPQRLLKNLLRALPLVLGLYLLTLLVRSHGSRLSIDGVSPLTHDWQQWLLLGPLYLGGLLLFWWARRRRKHRELIRAEAAQQALQELDPPCARERRLRERLERWRLESQASASGPVFLLLGAAGAGKRSLMGERGRRARGGDESPPDDLRPERLGAFSVMALSSALLTQADPGGVRLWRCLLDELQRSRRHGLGVAGVVLVLNAVHLLRLAPAARDAQALILRARLEELATEFGHGLPVQVIVTHCDRLPGFEPSLLDLPVEDRDLVLAFGRQRNRQNLAGLAERLVRTFAAVQDGLPERLQREAQTSARVQLYGFPRLWRQFGEVLQPYLQTAFFEQPRVAQVHLQSLRCGGHLRFEPGARAASQRLVRCLQQSRGHARWPGFLQAGAGRCLLALGAAALVILLATLLGNSYWQQTRQLQWLAEQQASLAALPASATGTSLTPAVLERLAVFRNLAHPPSDDWPQPAFWLSEYQRLLGQTRSLYQQALLDELLPRVVQSLQHSLPNEAHNESRERLRFYLMLGGQGRFESAAFEHWLSARVQGDLGQSLAPAQREQLQVHAQALIPLLATGPVLSVDPQWVEQVRRQLRSEPQQQRLYDRLSTMLASAGAEEFSVVAVSGSEGLLSLARRSGEPLNRGVPAHFSRSGYKQLRVRLPLLVAEALQEEDWVMGTGPRLDALTLHNEVSALYTQDYIRHWERFFADLRLVGLDQPESLALRLERLSRADSALFSLLRAAAHETRLEITQVPQRLVDRARQQVSSLASSFSSDPAKALADTIALEEHPINRHFMALQQLTEGNAVPLEALREALAQAAVYLQAREQALATGLPSPSVDALEQLKRQVDSLPPILQPLFADIVSVGRQHLHQQAVTTVGASLNLQLGPECSRLLAQRYPFDRQAREQLSLVDFNRLFAPSGLLEDFQQRHPDVTLLEGAVATQFRRAEQIRRAFFPGRSDVARVDFELSPVSMNESIAQVRLTLDDLQLNYSHGPIRPSLFTWPTRALGSQLRMVVTLIDGRTLVRSAEGPWAWFRFMEQGRLVPAPSGEGYWLTLGFEDIEVVLQLRSASLDHPFGRKILSDFRCPST